MNKKNSQTNRGPRARVTHDKYGNPSVDYRSKEEAEAEDWEEEGAWNAKQQAYRQWQAEQDDNNNDGVLDETKLNDIGNARRLIKQHGADLRYVAQWKSWYVWNGRYWEKDATGEVMRRAQKTAKSIYKEAAGEGNGKAIARWAIQSESAKHLQAMVKLAEFQEEVAVTPDAFDNQDWLLSCRNGTVDLRTGQMRKHDRKDMLTCALDFDYDAQAKCPTFLAFLDKIMAGNQNLIGFLQRAIGYTLTADVREECMFVPWGSGRNGKSTLLNAIRGLTGGYARSMNPDTLAASGKNQRSGSSASPDIARLKASRYVSTIEAEEGQRLNESRIKQMTSREPITARFNYQEDFEFPPTWKIWYGTNHKPEIRGTDTGIWRRIKLIPFRVTIGDDEVDDTLAEKLEAEYPGMFNWAIEGCLAWQQDGLGEPDVVKNATADYKNEMDVLGAFLKEYCVLMPHARILNKKLYAVYGEWCQETHEFQLKYRDFAKKLAERGYNKDRTAPNGANEWWGIGLKADYPNASSSASTASVNDPFASVNRPSTEATQNASVNTNPENKGPRNTSLKLLKHTEGFLGNFVTDDLSYRDLLENASECFGMLQFLQ